MTQQERTDIYQRRDALLASLNYTTDDEEMADIKQQIEALNQQLAGAKPAATDEDKQA